MNYKINIKCDLINIKESNLIKIKKKIQKLNNMYMKQNEKVSYYYEDINTGSIISYNSSILFYAASTIKILVCTLLLEKAENNNIDLNKKILIAMKDLKQGSGIIKNQKKDTYYTILELIKLAISESDNTAYIKLVNYVGKDTLEKYGKSLGAKHTLEGKDLFGLINCDDMIIYWKKIYNFINTSKYGKLFHKYLSNPSFNIIKKKYIGNNNFVKKYGCYEIAYHETGYVEDSNPFYLIILTQKFKTFDKEKFLNKTAQIIYDIHKLISAK